MKIGIYAKWLETLGGGEKVATVIAETLSKQGHEVDLITTFETDIKNIESKMSVDLSKVKLVAWQETSNNKLEEKTRKYDLFFNVSFLDHLPSLAKKSIYYVHFPTPIRRTIFGLLKYETIIPLLRRYLIIPTLSRGLEMVDEVVDAVTSRTGKLLKERNTIILSNPPKEFELKLVFYSDTLTLRSLDSVNISSDNAKITKVDSSIGHQNSTLYYKYRFKMKDTASAVINIKVAKDEVRHGIALVSMTVSNIRFLLWNMFKRYLPRYEMALYGSASYKPAGGIDTYNLFFTNSAFTKKWTARYWAKDSVILYPPVDIEKFKSDSVKKNMILNVGRIFVGGHSKRQDALINAFKQMIDEKLIDKTWELHLVGGVASGWEHVSYLRTLQSSATGYPIFFHFSTSFDELKELYAKSKIYWHATGYGQNEYRNPILFEHFGITVVEAMSAGCVPVVYKGGGLTESVPDSDLAWKSLGNLKKITQNLVNNKKILHKYSLYSKKQSIKFSRKNFEKKLLYYVDRLVHEEK